MEKRPYHLFDRVGVELEYMIVDKQTFGVKPLADKVLRAVTGSYYPQYVKPGVSWSNELALHVIELKTTEPVGILEKTVSPFQRDIVRINRILEEQNACLMPTGTHPWMDPLGEMVLWPHRYNAIYAAYNEIFDCRGHGWANVQSCHINLPFQGDDEFGRLHAAIRVLLPLLPALAASTPIVDGTVQGPLDYRLEAYRTNSQRIPSVTGAVIPEPVFTEQEYRDTILQRMYDDIRPYDPEGILQDEWLNARGAIARFDRSAIEIRVLDVQESPLADLAIGAIVVATLKALVAEAWCAGDTQKQWDTRELARILSLVVSRAENAVIDNQEYLALFGLRGKRAVTAGRLWHHIFAALEAGGALPTVFHGPLQTILQEGCLASRMIKWLAGAPVSRASLVPLCRELCACLRHGRLFSAHRR